MKDLSTSIRKLFERDSNIIDLLDFVQKSDGLSARVYRSHWLLSDIHSKKWYIRSKNSIPISDELNNEDEKLDEYIDVFGDVRKSRSHKYTWSVSWEQFLPDGSYLTDPINRTLLENLQKLSFLYIDDRYKSSGISSVGIHHLMNRVLAFIRWLFLYEKTFEPRIRGFSLIKTSDLQFYANKMAMQGSFLTMKCPSRIIKCLGLECRFRDERDGLQLPDGQVSKIEKLLTEKGLYTVVNGFNVVDRVNLSRCANISVSEFCSQTASLFLRQFEPDVLAKNSEVLLPIRSKLPNPSHKTPLIDEVLNKDSFLADNAREVSRFLFEIQKYHSEFKGMAPKENSILLSQINFPPKSDNHTPWLPIPIFCYILNHAIRMVLKDGDKVLGYLDNLIERLNNDGYLNRDNNIRYHKGSIAVELLPESLTHYGVTGFSKSENKFTYNQDSDMSVEALHSLILGACYIVIASLKPIRISEIQDLPYECLYFKKGDGYWLKQSLSKTNINEHYPDTEKPIPTIAAKAITLLQRMNRISRKVSTKSKPSEFNKLLFTIFPGNRNTKGSIPTTDTILTYTALFCEYIEVPFDAYGRRWHVNIHELRKCFLITFFWQYKHSSLDACRWIAGHKDIDHVYQYIEGNVPGEEVIAISAGYLSQQLRLFNSDSSASEMENTELLYQEACEHFGVKSISCIQASELDMWLQVMLAKERARIEFYAINYSSHEPTQTKVIYRRVKG